MSGKWRPFCHGLNVLTSKCFTPDSNKWKHMIIMYMYCKKSTICLNHDRSLNHARQKNIHFMTYLFKCYNCLLLSSVRILAYLMCLLLVYWCQGWRDYQVLCGVLYIVCVSVHVADRKQLRNIASDTQSLDNLIRSRIGHSVAPWGNLLTTITPHPANHTEYHVMVAIL